MTDSVTEHRMTRYASYWFQSAQTVPRRHQVPHNMLIQDREAYKPIVSGHIRLLVIGGQSWELGVVHLNLSPLLVKFDFLLGDGRSQSCLHRSQDDRCRFLLSLDHG